LKGSSDGELWLTLGVVLHGQNGRFSQKRQAVGYEIQIGCFNTDQVTKT
jgi:hypothetical protein